MKGTFFSGDFVYDSSNNPRLLEINTDTQISSTYLNYVDYQAFINVLSSNNITNLTVIYKPNIHENLVDHMESYLTQNASFITSITRIAESSNTIYPTSVPDEPNKFILRMAYDEAAILDSEYAKGTLNLLKLFNDYEDGDSVVEFYHSSSLHGVYDTISKDINQLNVPDAAVKNISENHQLSKFYKIGSEVSGELDTDRWNAFINNVKSEDIVIEKYHLNEGGVTNNRIESLRSFYILYGPELDLIPIAEYKVGAIFELPTVDIHNTGSYVNIIDQKHYYEFATNFVKHEGTFDGILNRHLIIKSDDSEVEAGSLQVGDELKSYYISNLSLDETTFEYLDWKISGNTLPSGSYMTSSVVIYKNTKQLTNKTLVNLEINGNEDSLFVAPNKSFLIYDSEDDNIKWSAALNVKSGSHYLIDYDGSTAPVTSNEVFISNDNDLTLVEIDVEDTDTYIIAGSVSVNSFVTHNAPCFVAGTKIIMEDGSIKNIEDVVEGDVVSTFDFKENKITYNKVQNVFSKKVEKIVEYTFENNDTLKCTVDHPIYVNGKGWCSFSEEASNKMYELDEPVKKIEVGDSVKLFNGDVKIIATNLIFGETVVYNLSDIENNHNFFANNILVHNRFCFIEGTKIELADGVTKNIEDVVVGDIVLCYNEVLGTQQYNQVTDVYSPVHDDLVKYTFSNGSELTCTQDHPIYLSDLTLASASPMLTNERYTLNKEIKKSEVGQIVILSSGENGEITNIEVLERNSVKTYIFTVENTNNFYANGILVHNKYCFIAGTQVSLANGTTKNIEDVQIGDEVVSFNEVSLTNEMKPVTKLMSPEHDDLVTYSFSNGTSLTCTLDHPFYVSGLMLASQSPELTNERYDLGKEVVQINVGDIVYLENGETTTIDKIDVLERNITQTYIFTVEGNNNFYANGILVHNKV